MSETGVPEIEELIGAYALDAVDDHERELVEQHLAVCARCRAELAEHREVAALLAYDGKPAPSTVWDRIVSSLEEPPPALRLKLDSPTDASRSDVVSIDERRARNQRRAYAALAGVAAALALVVGIVVVRDDGQPAGVERDLAAVAGEALVDPTSSRTTLRPPGAAAGPEATAVVTADGTGFILADDLPALADDRTYQLWGIANGQAISLGVLGADFDVAAFQVDDTTEFGAFAITEETAGGVIASQNDPFLVGETA